MQTFKQSVRAGMSQASAREAAKTDISRSGTWRHSLYPPSLRHAVIYDSVITEVGLSLSKGSPLQTDGAAVQSPTALTNG